MCCHTVRCACRTRDFGPRVHVRFEWKQLACGLTQGKNLTIVFLCQAKPEAAHAQDDLDQGTDRSTHVLRCNRLGDDKGATPETTPAGSDGPAGSPTCPASETANSKEGDASPESAKTDFALNTHVYSSIEASVSSSADPAPFVGDALSNEDAANNAASESGAEKEAHKSAAPTEAAKSKSATEGKAGSKLLSADQQLVESLIAAAAGNSVQEDGDTEMSDATVQVAKSVFALSDCTSSLPLKRGDGPSAEDKLVMATLLGLAGVPRQKSEDVTGSENGEDEEDAASAQDSSRKEDCSDADEMDDDSKTDKDFKCAKVPGKRGPKKKKDAAAESKADCDDEDDCDDDDDDGKAGKSTTKSKKDADGDEPKARGRKGKKQVSFLCSRLCQHNHPLLRVVRLTSTS